MVRDAKVFGGRGANLRKDFVEFQGNGHKCFADRDSYESIFRKAE